MLKRVFLSLLIAATIACKASPSKPVIVSATDLQPDKQQMIVCKQIAALISGYNYKKVPLNDSISSIIYDRYIKALDENRTYFLASDIKAFEKYRTILDDDIKEGNLNAAFHIFNVFQVRFNERMQYALARINKDFDFTQKETVDFDRSKLPWPTTEAEMNIVWDQRVKYNLLSLKLANKDMEKNKATLKKRYENLVAQTNKFSNQDVFQYFMDAFTMAIDPHTNYFNPSNAANYNIEMSRQLEGIGAGLNIENEYIVIKSIVAGGPADKTKQINIDDRIIGVAQGKSTEFENIVGWRLENVLAIIRGTKGTTVRLEILPAGASASAKPKIVEIVRDKIILKDQSAKKEIRTYKENGKDVKIGVISIPAFYIDFNDYRAGNPDYKSTTRDVRLLLDTLKQENVNGVIIDIRGNGGGSLLEAIELTGLFIKTGPVVQVRDSKNKVNVEADEDPSISYDGPLTVLVDRSSASASEIFAAALQDYGRAIILGTQTYGKGTVQNAINLDKLLGVPVSEGKSKTSTGGESTYGQLNLTMAKFYRINGSATQHKGVIPDIQFPSLIPLDKYGEDTEPSAMPFDVIPKTAYSKAGDLSAVIPELKKIHDQRMSTSDSYKYMLEDIADFKAQENDNTVSLNEVDLKKQRDADEEKNLIKVNRRRVALGYPPIKKGDKRPANEDLDFLKKEAGQILTDYITRLRS